MGTSRGLTLPDLHSLCGLGSTVSLSIEWKVQGQGVKTAESKDHNTEGPKGIWTLLAHPTSKPVIFVPYKFLCFHPGSLGNFYYCPPRFVFHLLKGLVLDHCTLFPRVSWETVNSTHSGFQNNDSNCIRWRSGS